MADLAIVWFACFKCVGFYLLLVLSGESTMATTTFRIGIERCLTKLQLEELAERLEDRLYKLFDGGTQYGVDLPTLRMVYPNKYAVYQRLQHAYDAAELLVDHTFTTKRIMRIDGGWVLRTTRHGSTNEVSNRPVSDQYVHDFIHDDPHMARQFIARMGSLLDDADLSE